MAARKSGSSKAKAGSKTSGSKTGTKRKRTSGAKSKQSAPKAATRRKAKAKAAPKAKAKPAAKSSAGATSEPKSRYTLKTKPTATSVDAFLDSIADAGKRADARVVLQMMQDITGEAPKMWGPSIVGFGKYHYRYESGHEGDMCMAGFSPRSTALTVYVVPGFERYGDIMSRLGKYTTGKSCLYIKRLNDVNVGALRELIAASIAEVRRKYPG